MILSKTTKDKKAMYMGNGALDAHRVLIIFLVSPVIASSFVFFAVAVAAWRSARLGVGATAAAGDVWEVDGPEVLPRGIGNCFGQHLPRAHC